ncbi:ankyrin repeat-containing domain protein [Podospora aff. communis PSN243]|uniref:Ankyrin repeat-containing domain protein n=1 Tax=Podospora aff. communis PSN243 TaxID=3040156 RepID=A0AAV9GTI5_9PEZI|nr:ankyrin repeat-containing domain protein [Podospora aff. communis PSN243]
MEFQSSQQVQGPPAATATGSASGRENNAQPATAGIRVGNVNKSIIADSVENAQDVNFESTKGAPGAPGGFEQSILANKLDIHGAVNYTSMCLIDGRYDDKLLLTRGQDTSAPSSESNPKEAFTRSPYKFQSLQHRYQQTASQSPGSGKWFLKSEDFVEWKEKDSIRKLRLVGELGAGKTILASTVIHHLEHKYSSRKFACLYVYFDYEQKQQTYEKLLAELLCQLIRHGDRVTPEVEEVYNTWTSKNIPPGPEDYIRMIKSEIETFTKVFIVIDAFDECPEEHPEYTASSFMKALDQLPKKTHILFTSRPLAMIHDLVNADKSVIVRTNIDDLKAYFKNRINSAIWLKKLVEKGKEKNPDFFQNAVDTIVNRSQGMFLLARLHVETLITKRTLEDLELGIKELPADLNEVYAKALKQIQDQAEWKKKLAIKVLNWLVYAERPLSLDELIHALGVKEEDTKFHQDRLWTEQDIALACSGIVLADADSRTVSLTHQTAKEYLRSSGILEDPHSYLATTCLVYMSFEDFSATMHTKKEREDRIQQYPFLKYAADYWGDHVDRGVKGPIRERAWRFLNNAPKLQSAFQVMTDFPFHKEAGVSGLHIAAYFGLTKLVTSAIKRTGPLPINATTHSGETALHWAARYQQSTFLKLLVENGADLNLVDNVRSRNQTALHQAVINRDMASVKVLLESKRCEVHLADAQNWTPLRWAAAYGHGSLVKLLLAHGAKVDDRDKDGWTALRWAVQKGHMHVAKVLISAGADIRSPLGGDADRRTLLQWAASEGRDPLVRLLIKRGVDVDATDDKGQTALCWAAMYGHGISAWLLLQWGASMNKADKAGFTPLHAAVQSWSPSGGPNSGGGASSSLLWMLLEHRSGADVNAKTRHGFTPLHLAAQNGFAPVIWLLLEKGADPMQKDTTGCTPLHCAAATNHIEVAGLLLAQQRGDLKLVRAVDNEGRTALHAAASGGYPDVVQVLLDGGALPVIDVRDGEGYTALRRAVKKQYLEVVICLVKAGADVNMPGRKGKTALHLAMAEGNEGIINALLEAETIDQTIKDSKGQTAWDVAEKKGLNVRAFKRQVHFEE